MITESLNCIELDAVYYRQLELRTRDTKVTLAPLRLAEYQRPAGGQPDGQGIAIYTSAQLGKETLWRSPSVRESSLGLKDLSAMQPTIRDGEEENKTATNSTCCLHSLRLTEKMQVRVGMLLHLLWKKADPKCTC